MDVALTKRSVGILDVANRADMLALLREKFHDNTPHAGKGRITRGGHVCYNFRE